jgi:hypothetical protein
VERLGRGSVREALLESPRGPSLRLLPIAMGMVVAGTVLLFVPDMAGLRQPFWSPAGLALILLAIAGFFGGRLVLGPRLVRVERAWLLSLPFPVRGYFRTLGQSPEEERSVRVRIVFRGAVPEREVLEGLFGRVVYPATARITGGNGTRWTAESGPIRSYVSDDIAATNGPVLGWMRCVVEDVLLPLHEAYPLRSARFGG